MPRPLSPDQDQRDREEIRADDPSLCGLFWRARSSTFCPCSARTRSGTRTRFRIDARGVGAEYRVSLLTDAKAVKSVVEEFREKYGAKDVKKYYSKFDMAVVVALS
jgi:hypothetical protein